MNSHNIISVDHSGNSIKPGDMVKSTLNGVIHIVQETRLNQIRVNHNWTHGFNYILIKE